MSIDNIKQFYFINAKEYYNRSCQSETSRGFYAAAVGIDGVVRNKFVITTGTNFCRICGHKEVLGSG